MDHPYGVLLIIISFPDFNKKQNLKFPPLLNPVRSLPATPEDRTGYFNVKL
jgi:hypothetical protein